MRKKMVLVSTLAVLGTFFVMKGLDTKIKTTFGTVMKVEIKAISGHLFSPPKTLTIVTFKDGRVVVFRNLVSGICLNKCNEFWKKRLTRKVGVHSCED